MFVPSLACEPNSTLVPSSTSNFPDIFPNLVSDDGSEDENPPPPAHVPLVAPAPMPPQWVHSTCEAAGVLTGDPSNQRQTCSQFQ